VLLSRLGTWAAELLRVAQGAGDDDGAVRGVDDALEGGVRNDPDLDETTRRAVIEARRGQGRFRLNVEAVEQRCRISGVSDLRLLKASHIKPWRSCSTTAERLDGNNGLLLCPNVDHLFDRGYISFEDEGRVLMSPLVDEAQIALLGVSTAPPLNVGPFNVGQTDYLRFHRRPPRKGTPVLLHERRQRSPCDRRPGVYVMGHEGRRFDGKIQRCPGCVSSADGNNGSLEDVR
jgi:putative restriction endonuclease